MYPLFCGELSSQVSGSIFFVVKLIFQSIQDFTKDMHWMFCGCFMQEILQLIPASVDKIPAILSSSKVSGCSGLEKDAAYSLFGVDAQN